MLLVMPRMSRPSNSAKGIVKLCSYTLDTTNLLAYGINSGEAITVTVRLLQYAGVDSSLVSQLHKAIYYILFYLFQGRRDVGRAIAE